MNIETVYSSLCTGIFCTFIFGCPLFFFLSPIVFKGSFYGPMMIGNNDGCMWVIAESVLCTFGMKFQNWEKSGKRMSSHDVQICSQFFILFRLFDHTVVGQRDWSVSYPICKVAKNHEVGAEFNMGILGFIRCIPKWHPSLDNHTNNLQ